MMSIEDYKKLIVEFYVDVVSNMDEEEIKKYFHEKIVPLVHPEFISYAPDYRKDMIPDKTSDLLEIILENKKGLPNLKYKCIDIFGENDKICFVGYFSGKHEGELVGIEPTGNIMEGIFCQTYTIKDEKLYAVRLFNDSLSLFQQIGKAVLLEDNEIQVKNYFTLLHKLGLLPEKAIMSK